ncbi:MAG: GAF domain-containing protein, partial [Cyanothece sp. SIO1E1]|nr:GAF domain-containing protein [Cyanothece sp. SIO1E1]
MQSDRVVVYTFDENWKGTIVAESMMGDWPRALGAKIADPCFAEDYVEKYKQGRVQATPNIQEAGLTKCHLEQLEPFAIKANLVAPIVVKGELPGLLIAHQCSGPRVWQDSEVDFFSQLATQVGFAVERTNLLEEQQAEAERSEMLKDITLSLSTSLNTQEVFDKAVQEIRPAMQSDRVVVYTFDENWKGTIVAESMMGDWPRALGAKIADPCFAEDYVEKYKQGRVQATPNIQEAGLTKCHLEQLEPFAIKANLVAPIVVKGELPGLLIAHQCSGPRAWQDAEVNFFSQLATQVGLAVERTNLLEEQQAEAERSEMLKDITLSLSTSLSTQEVFDKAVQEIRPVMQSDRVVVYTFDENWKGTIVAESMMGDWPRALGAKIADPCFAEDYVEKYKQGRVQATPNIQEAGLTKCHLEQLEPFAIKANLVAPIVVKGELPGLLIAHQCSGPRAWQDAEVNFFSQLATQVGLAVERTDLLEEQQAEAERSEMLKDITLSLSTSLNTQEVFDKAVQEIRPAMQSDRVIVYTFDESWKGTVVAESLMGDWPRALGAQIADPCFAEDYVEKYKQGRVQATPNIREAGLTKCHLEQLEPFAIKANLVAPIVVKGELPGLLIAHQCSGPRAWQDAEVNFFSQSLSIFCWTASAPAQAVG